MPLPESAGAAERAYLVDVLRRVAEPVLDAAANNRLKQDMPRLRNDRDAYQHLEALGRTLAGIAPWLELGPGDDSEGRLRAHFIDLTTRAITHCVTPGEPDYLDFGLEAQCLVDAAFLAHALLRAPNQLWGKLDGGTRRHLVRSLQLTRAVKPPPSNWLLFSAMVEAAQMELAGEYIPEPIDLAVDRHLEWYLGDATYGDGPVFHWDYYNSFVIQPMLLDVLEACERKGLPIGQHGPLVRKRMRRQAEIQERLISPEGTFPIIGRSAAYRFGAFQVLAQIALRAELPTCLTPGGVRSALTAVIRRMTEAPGTFDAGGWLNIGIVGHQPSSREHYINRGSIYLCSVGLLHLGLPADDPFWTAPAAPWTQQRIWSGEDLPADHAL